jgi:hypothetical protein
MAYIVPPDTIASAIYFAPYIDVSKDMVISFDYACYGPDVTGSEGFCVFFTNTIADAVRYGGIGPGLGYSAVSGIDVNQLTSLGDPLQTLYGIEYGVLGVGFDTTGNFGNKTYFNSGSEDVLPNTITLRGEDGSKYSFLTRTLNLQNASYERPFSIYQQVTPQTTPTYKSIRIRLTDFGQRIIIDAKNIDDNNFINYLDYSFGGQKVWPVTVRCGLAFTTGQ